MGRVLCGRGRAAYQPPICAQSDLARGLRGGWPLVEVPSQPASQPARARCLAPSLLAPLLTLPIIARPRPPFGAHSSFATRSSLFARIALQSVVTLWPWLFVSVCAGGGLVSAVPRQRGEGGARAREVVAHLEAVEHAVAAKELARAGVLGRPGKNLVAGAGHDRRGMMGMSSAGKSRRREGGGAAPDRTTCAVWRRRVRTDGTGSRALYACTQCENFCFWRAH